MPLDKDWFLKRLGKKANRGMRGRPAATIAFYGPDASRATKVVVGIVPSEHEELESCETGKSRAATCATMWRSEQRFWSS
jgi:hypothetical protein